MQILFKAIFNLLKPRGYLNYHQV